MGIILSTSYSNVHLSIVFKNVHNIYYYNSSAFDYTVQRKKVTLFSVIFYI